ncbi:hypothetical protein [uncultured Aquimarina sp.]|uniref:hypothetical protein n=1 Tax=uncultured Aquimarina sp. TaxID=575652 RepID=UPI00260AA742|nr:hypothetical protein [uncultured Aquimarina sp.]
MKNIFILIILLLSVQLYAQSPEQIMLPDHKGFKMKGYQESRYGFIYMDYNNHIYNTRGDQVKNPNKITVELKKNKYRIDRAYVFADKRILYSTIDKINTTVARSGIEHICYMMSFPVNHRTTSGYIKKLQVPTDTIGDELKASKNKPLTHTHMIITSDNHKVRMMDGKKVEIDSREYKKIINSSDVITVDYMDDITYGDYIYWLDKTQRIIKKQRRKKGGKTVINEVPKELMRHNKAQTHQEKINSNDN